MRADISQLDFHIKFYTSIENVSGNIPLHVAATLGCQYQKLIIYAFVNAYKYICMCLYIIYLISFFL